MDRGDWQATVHGVTKTWIGLSLEARGKGREQQLPERETELLSGSSSQRQRETERGEERDSPAGEATGRGRHFRTRKPAHQTLRREGCGGDITKDSSHLLSSGQTQPDTKRQGTQPLTSGRGRQSGEEQGASLEADLQMPGAGQGAGQWRGHGSEGRSVEAANPALLLAEAGDLFLVLDFHFLHFLPC